MLTISKLKTNVAGIVAYYILNKEDYYLNGHDKEGRWLGVGARILGLHGKKVEREVFKNLLEGFSPDRTVGLVQNPGAPSRQCGWDLTFNAPKSVSVLWALASRKRRRQIELAHALAVEATLARLQRIAGVTRRGKGGGKEEKALLLFAVFREGTSRALDPHVHDHVILVNLAFRPDTSTGTLHSIRFFELKKVLGKDYRDELAKNLQQLGLTIEPERVGFHVVGVPRDLCRASSRRRQQIEKWMEKHGLAGAIAAKEAAIQTRPKKQDVAQSGLFGAWQKMAEQFAWGPEQAAQLFQSRSQQRVTEPGAAEQRGPSDCIDRSRVPEDKTALVRPAPFVPSDGDRHDTASRSRKRTPRAISPPFFRVEWHPLLDKTPWLAPKRRFMSIEWQKAFPTLPWRQSRNLKVPRVTLAIPKFAMGPKKEFKPKWWTILAKREVLLGELRVQNRILFPNAPKWSPLHGLSLPALRITGRRSEWKPIDFDKDRDISRSR